jgi:hypothetical protein
VADLSHYIRKVAHRLIKVVVHHDARGDLKALGLLTAAQLYAGADVLLRVAPGPEALLLHLARRRADKNANSVGIPPEHLAGALDVYFEHHVTALWGLWRGRPVVLTENLRPLEEAVFSDAS